MVVMKSFPQDLTKGYCLKVEVSMIKHFDEFGSSSLACHVSFRYLDLDATDFVIRVPTLLRHD
jgi:hypothetical protein